MQQKLLDMGDWLQINGTNTQEIIYVGEAIYNTRSWTTYNDSLTLFYTQNKQLNSVYALFTEWPGMLFRMLIKKPIIFSYYPLLKLLKAL